MERLDFASVMAVLRRNIPDEDFSNQADFLYSLFADFAGADSGVDEVVDFYTGQACRWINGQARLSPSIIDFYKSERNKKKLFNRIESEILPLMPDSAMAAQELYDLVLQAPNVSQQKKMELTDGFSFEDKNDEAMFATDILCLAMQLRFEKRDVRKKQLLTPGNLSPAVVDYIFDTDIPRPCRWFLGREQELEQLHALLVDHSKVFLHGIPGIGKSELAKAYAKQYGKEYTNVIYVNYPGDLLQAVIDLDFADDMPDESDDTRFKRHNRFLRSLREDTLLIMDNFNVTASQDQFLDVMLKYRCRILFTTRSRYENHISLEVGELNPDTLLELAGKFFPEAERNLNYVPTDKKSRYKVAAHPLLAIKMSAQNYALYSAKLQKLRGRNCAAQKNMIKRSSNILPLLCVRLDFWEIMSIIFTWIGVSGNIDSPHNSNYVVMSSYIV